MAIPKKARDYQKELDSFIRENKTLANLILKNTKKFAQHDALKQKVKGKWVITKWKDFGEQVRAAAKGILELDLLKPGEMGGIFSANRAEWHIADVAILAVRGVSVPIYATNSSEEALYIVEDAEIKVLFVGDQVQYDKAKQIRKKSGYLKKIIALDRDIKIEGEDSLYLDELIAIGRNSSREPELEKRLQEANPDDLLTLIYTSGTTGAPKGAIHSHRSFMGGIYPSLTRFPHVGPGYVTMAILPLSHVFERMWSYGAMTVGMCVAYCPDPKQFLEYVTEIKPHFMCSVPRIWDKVYGTIQEGLKTAPPLKARLFKWAEKTALEVYRLKAARKTPSLVLRFKHAVARKLVISKVHKTLGTENCDVYHVGGAAFAPDVNEFFFAFEINTIQGYGLTEFFPVAVGFDGHGIPGMCGPMLPLCQARISDEGEIQLKGPMCMLGYYKKPEATKECFTEDGWFKTGDIGKIEQVEKDGETFSYIKITDRIKDIIITAGGKNISPQQIESLFGDELFIEQIVVVGEGKKFISALVVPNFVILEDYCQKNNIPYHSREDIVKHPSIIKMYEEIIEKRTVSLGQVEKIKKFTLLTKELTQEDGELTPTLKVKRKVINQKYAEIIDKMYKE
ncbi:long-chain acyl-CoA synthetase [Thermosyntropha lipolytica DSM 11003]|uniref:Acyl-CoA synthetase n=1 Tax=Thermosyntropha lipolytica DSM 11003 TaxID=1123382 RepID=A0A1M5PWV5_9FIRM|nr:long-chain fatty acid--CoA ligase [Thermosyntropha lipolytica]SHH06308.1 long-chain acyl-CoA synthetase [Thermosyntropha lipolytica DSM 11003]